MQFDYNTLLIVCPLIFLAGFIDSIAGGGGLISIPSYVFAGLPIHFAYGTNKFSSVFGTFISTVRFMRSGNIHYKSAGISTFCALVGSFVGARMALLLSDIYLKYCLIILVPIIAVFLLTRKGFGITEKNIVLSDKRTFSLSALSGLVIGAYDGFFGPGTGTFLILVYTGVIGLNVTTACGNAKIVNFASNISAVFTFMAGGKILYEVGIPAALFGVLGNWIGSGLAIKNGSKVVKPMFIVVLSLLFIKIVSDII